MAFVLQHPETGVTVTLSGPGGLCAELSAAWRREGWVLCNPRQPDSPSTVSAGNISPAALASIAARLRSLLSALRYTADALSVIASAELPALLSTSISQPT